MTLPYYGEIGKLAIVNAIQLKNRNHTCLFTSYNKMIKEYKKATWNSSRESIFGRLYLWQLCSEFFWFQTSVTRKDLFGNTLRNE